MNETATAQPATSSATAPVILDMRALAVVLKMSYSTIRSIRAQGGGPPPTYMAGTRPRWTIAAVNAWLARQEQNASAEKKGRR